MASLDEEAIEITLATVSRCFAFQIPPRPRAGHKASEWPKEHIWAGRLRVSDKNGQAVICLEHNDGTEGLFLACPVADAASVEQVTDSSRYFALHLKSDKGRSVFVGLGFSTREDSFDFKVALQEVQKQRDAEKEAEQASLSQEPHHDFSIPEGQMLTLKSMGKSDKPRKRLDKGPRAPSIGDSSALKLAPPPAASKKKKKKKKKKRPQKKQQNDDDLLIET